MPRVVPEYKEAAKTKIIETARAVFSEKGYHDATMDDIARELGVSKGALYSYFRSKEDLLVEISQQIHTTLRETVEKTCENPELVPALEEIYNMILGKYKDTLHTHFEIIASASHDQKIKKIIMADYQEDIDAVRIFMECKIRQGLIRSDIDAGTLAKLSVSLYLGTMAMLVIGFDNEEVHGDWIKSMLLVLNAPKE